MTILFDRTSTLHDQLRARVAKAKTMLDTATLATLADEAGWIKKLATAMVVAPIELRISEADTPPPRETELRDQSGRSRPGAQYSVRFPFSGDPLLLHHRASEGLLIVMEGEVAGGFIVFSEVFSQPVDAQRVIAWRRELAGRLEQLVGFANTEVATYNLTVESMAANAYFARKQTLQALHDAQSEIGDTGI